MTGWSRTSWASWAQGAGEVVGASVLAPLAGRTAEGAVNAFLVDRLGSAAVRLIQPIRRS